MPGHAAVWRMPLAATHHLAASAGCLTFVGGAGDFDERGAIHHPDDLFSQVPGTVNNIADALAVELCEPADIRKPSVVTDASIRYTVSASPSTRRVPTTAPGWREWKKWKALYPATPATPVTSSGSGMSGGGCEVGICDGGRPDHPFFSIGDGLFPF